MHNKTGEIKKYLVKLSNQILVQENDFVKAGMPLSDGSITPNDILNIKLLFIILTISNKSLIMNYQFTNN